MRAVLWLSLLTACGRFDFDAARVTERPIEIAGSMIPTALSDFPLWVHLDPAPTGALEFLDASDAVLPYESESPNDYWVRVAIAGDETIRARYGELDVAANEPTRVWDSNFVGVWHFNDAHDSTAYHHDGAFTGTVASPGIVAGARTAAGGWMTVPDDAVIDSVATSTGLTLEMWTNVAVAPTAQYTLITRQTDATGNDDFRLGVGSGPKVHSEFTVDPLLVNASFNLGLISIGAWQVLAVTRTAATGAVEHSIDGVTGGTGTVTGAIHTDANALVFGADCNTCGANPNDDFYLGAMDEARISNVVRSLDWIRAEYLNLTGQLVR